MKLSKWAKIQGISYWTAWRWFRQGVLPVKASQLSTGTIIVENNPETTTNLTKRAVIYCRVSSPNKKDDLERQIQRCCEFAAAQGVSIDKIYKEIASGMNDKRREMLRMLDSNPTSIFIENKDRLTRFGFNYLDYLLRKQGCNIIVINKDVEEENDLMKDLISVITSFCCRVYGLRRGQSTAKKIKNIIKDKEND